MIRRSIVWFVVLWWMLPAAQAEVRTWTARTGGFTVRAELVDVAKGAVVLRKLDGTLITVPLDRLSLADVRYVSQVLKAAQQDIGSGDAHRRGFGRQEAKSGQATRGSRSKPAPRRSTAASAHRVPAVKGPPLARPNVSRWQVEADPGLALQLQVPRDLAVHLTGPYTSFKLLFPAAASPFVTLQFNRGLEERFVQWDLRNGKKAGEVVFHGGYRSHRAVSCDGLYLATFQPGKGQIQVWSFQTGALLTELALERRFSSVNFLQFAADDRLLVGTIVPSRVSVWDVKAGEAVVQIAMARPTQAKDTALSPGGHYLATFESPGAIRIVDVRNGAVAGMLRLPEESRSPLLQCGGLSFAPDGKEFAALLGHGGGSTLALWSLKDGKWINKLKLPQPLYRLVDSGSSYQGPPLEFLPDDRGWLAFGRGVIDRDAGGPVWVEERGSDHLQQHLPRRVLADGRVVRVTGEQTTRVIRAVELPWEQIREGKQVVEKGGLAIDRRLPPLTCADWSSARQVPFVTGKTAWSVREPGVPSGPAARSRPIPLGVQPLTVQSLYLSSRDPQLATLVLRRQIEHGRLLDGYLPQEVVRFDLRGGKVAGKLVPEFGGQVCDVSPSGQRLVMVTDKTHSRVDVFDIGNGRHVAGFRPYPSEDGRIQPVRWAALLDDQRLLTLSSAGKMVIWTLPACQATVATQLQLDNRPDMVVSVCWLTASRAYIVVASGGKLHLLESEGLQCCGRLQQAPIMSGPFYVTALAPRPDGKRLAAELSSDHGHALVIWNLEDGTVVRSFPLQIGGTALSWAGDKHLLVHGFRMRRRAIAGVDSSLRSQVASLIDIQRGCVVWTYLIPFGHIARVGADRRFWYLDGSPLGTEAMLHAVVLPTAAAKKALAEAPQPQPVVKPGSQIAVVVKLRLDGPPQSNDLLRTQIEKDIRKQLASRKLRVSDRAPLALVVTINEESTGPDLLYRRVGEPEVLRARETRVVCSLSVRDVKGKVLWTRTQSFSNKRERTVEVYPANVSIAEHLRRQQWAKVLAWFQAGGFPKTIYEPFSPGGLGESKLGPGGETDVHRF